MSESDIFLDDNVDIDALCVLEPDQQQAINQELASQLDAKYDAIQKNITYRVLGAAVDTNPKIRANYGQVEKQRKAELSVGKSATLRKPKYDAAYFRGLHSSSKDSEPETSASGQHKAVQNNITSVQDPDTPQIKSPFRTYNKSPPANRRSLSPSNTNRSSISFRTFTESRRLQVARDPKSIHAPGLAASMPAAAHNLLHRARTAFAVETYFQQLLTRFSGRFANTLHFDPPYHLATISLQPPASIPEPGPPPSSAYDALVDLPYMAMLQIHLTLLRMTPLQRGNRFFQQVMRGKWGQKLVLAGFWYCYSFLICSREAAHQEVRMSRARKMGITLEELEMLQLAIESGAIERGSVKAQGLSTEQEQEDTEAAALLAAYNPPKEIADRIEAILKRMAVVYIDLHRTLEDLLANHSHYNVHTVQREIFSCVLGAVPWLVADAVYELFIKILPGSIVDFTATFKAEIFLTLSRLIMGVEVTTAYIFHNMDTRFAPLHLLPSHLRTGPDQAEMILALSKMFQTSQEIFFRQNNSFRSGPILPKDPNLLEEEVSKAHKLPFLLPDFSPSQEELDEVLAYPKNFSYAHLDANEISDAYSSAGWAVSARRSIPSSFATHSSSHRPSSQARARSLSPSAQDPLSDTSACGSHAAVAAQSSEAASRASGALNSPKSSPPATPSTPTNATTSTSNNGALASYPLRFHNTPYFTPGTKNATPTVQKYPLAKELWEHLQAKALGYRAGPDIFTSKGKAVKMDLRSICRIEIARKLLPAIALPSTSFLVTGAPVPLTMLVPTSNVQLFSVEDHPHLQREVVTIPRIKKFLLRSTPLANKQTEEERAVAVQERLAPRSPRRLTKEMMTDAAESRPITPLFLSPPVSAPASAVSGRGALSTPRQMRDSFSSAPTSPFSAISGTLGPDEEFFFARPKATAPSTPKQEISVAESSSLASLPVAAIPYTTAAHPFFASPTVSRTRRMDLLSRTFAAPHPAQSQSHTDPLLQHSTPSRRGITISTDSAHPSVGVSANTPLNTSLNTSHASFSNASTRRNSVYSAASTHITASEAPADDTDPFRETHVSLSAKTGALLISAENAATSILATSRQRPLVIPFSTTGTTGLFDRAIRAIEAEKVRGDAARSNSPHRAPPSSPPPSTTSGTASGTRSVATPVSPLRSPSPPTTATVTFPGTGGTVGFGVHTRSAPQKLEESASSSSLDPLGALSARSNTSAGAARDSSTATTVEAVTGVDRETLRSNTATGLDGDTGEDLVNTVPVMSVDYHVMRKTGLGPTVRITEFTVPLPYSAFDASSLLTNWDEEDDEEEEVAKKAKEKREEVDANSPMDVEKTPPKVHPLSRAVLRNSHAAQARAKQQTTALLSSGEAARQEIAQQAKKQLDTLYSLSRRELSQVSVLAKHERYNRMQQRATENARNRVQKSWEKLHASNPDGSLPRPVPKATNTVQPGRLNMFKLATLANAHGDWRGNPTFFLKKSEDTEFPPI